MNVEVLPTLRIVLLAIAAAISYGIAHDLVTAHVCLEYFTVAHPPLFPTEDPVLLAIGWGVVATWWVGLILGLLLAHAALRGPEPAVSTRALVRPIAKLLAVMALCAACAGFVGWLGMQAGWWTMIGPLATSIPTAKHAGFVADSAAHLTSYVVGAVGGIVLARRVRRARRVGARGSP
ncbi:MAG: hypothetical protein JNL12_07785 [Planctomycetes bacterium]|nr:hypothetical protein [Planctomycetota bacterium]